jgi:hypothetical protein
MAPNNSDGGIRNDGTAIVVGSTISDNEVRDCAGGIGNYGPLTVLNSTISGNSAAECPGGGLYDQGAAQISFTTIFGNTALGSGGNIFADGTVTTFKNSIVADGTPDNCEVIDAGTIVDGGGNLSTDATCSTFTQVTLAELNLGPLADNGGPTQTHALLVGSVAIDAAPDCLDIDGATVTEDQRGEPRPVDGDGDGTATCDIGAFELQDGGEPPPPDDLPDLTVTKLCPSGNSTPPSAFFLTVDVLPGSTPIICGQTVAFTDVPTGLVTISETITAAGNAVFASAITCGGVGQVGPTLTIQTAMGDDIACFVVNNAGTTTAPPVPPVVGPGGSITIGGTTIVVPITIANTNTNTNNNLTTNTNTTTNTNVTTNTNTNTQNQSNSQTQTGGQDQNAEAFGGALAVSPDAVLGQGGVPSVWGGTHIRPPSTGDAGLASDERESSVSLVLIAAVAASLTGIAGFLPVRR